MIEKISIENYKCFKNMTLNDLGQINVIVGPNSAGKTALMEAIFLASGINPELALRAKTFRGMPSRSSFNNKLSYEELWKDLFYDFDQNKTIEISFDGALQFSRKLTIAYQHDKPLVLELKNNISSTVIPIRFNWDFPLKKCSIIADPEIHQENIEIKISIRINEAGVPVSIDELIIPLGFYSVSVISPDEQAYYFSQLSVHNKEELLLTSIQKQFPFITGLSLQVWSGNTIIFASVKNIKEKIPLNLVSAGVSKLVGILLAIANQENGVICIDEIENGFYFDKLLSIWELIFEFSKIYNVQIFASTHSWECLQAVSEYASNNKISPKFRLIQALSEEQHGFRVHSGDAFIDAVNHHIDIR